MDERFALAFSFDSPGPETTFEIASLLGRSIGARGLAIGLIGPLGSGKTLFVKGLAEGLGVDPRIVSSPTFVIAQQYPLTEGPEVLHHLDLYRLESEAELESIGFLDLLGPGQVLAVEWLDRFPDVLGDERLEIEFEPLQATVSAVAGAEFDAGRRHFRATAWGDEAARILRDWQARWERLEREETEAVDASGTRGDAAKLVLALVLSGIVGGRALAGVPDSPLMGCEALAPATAGFLLGEPEWDALGGVAVGCAPTGPEATQEGRLEGIARLLDGGCIDPNTAPQALLENLPGVGPGRSAAIVEARERSPFETIRALERVPGIGPRTREKLEPFLAVDSKAPPG